MDDFCNLSLLKKTCVSSLVVNYGLQLLLIDSIVYIYVII